MFVEVVKWLRHQHAGYLTCTSHTAWTSCILMDTQPKFLMSIFFSLFSRMYMNYDACVHTGSTDIMTHKVHTAYTCALFVHSVWKCIVTFGGENPDLKSETRKKPP